jgi:hypothetical protein
MPDFIIDREGWRIVTIDLWWNVNIRHKKRYYMTVSDLSLRFSSYKWIFLVVSVSYQPAVMWFLENPKNGSKNRKKKFNTGRDPTIQPHSLESHDFSCKKCVLRGHRRSNPQLPPSCVSPLTTQLLRCLCLFRIFVLSILCHSGFEMNI